MDWIIAQTEPAGRNFWTIERTTGSIFTQPAFWWILGAVVVTAIVCFLISRVPSNMRKWVIVGFTFVSGMFYVGEWLIPKVRTPAGETQAPILGMNYLDALPVVSVISQILTSILLAVGVISIFRLHFGRLFKMQRDWFFSGVLMLSMFAMLIFGFFDYSSGKNSEIRTATIDKALALSAREGTGNQITDQIQAWARLGIERDARDAKKAQENQLDRKVKKGVLTPEAALAEWTTVANETDTVAQEAITKLEADIASGKLSSDIASKAKTGARTETERTFAAQGYRFIFSDIFQRLEAVMFSLIAFFILSAAFRAFRIRSIEATIMMVTALIVLASFVPFMLKLTEPLPTNAQVDSVGLWILTYINSPALRAINLGLALGVVAMALRIMLGLEKGMSAD